MNSNNKQIRDVAGVAARIMYGQQPVTEKLHPNQQVLDVHEPEKDELTADDFKKLRAKKEVKKEEVESIDELSINTLTRVKHAATSAASDASRESDEGKATKRYDLAGKASNKIETKNRALGLKPSGQHAFEEVEELDEVSLKTATSAYVARMGREDNKSPLKAVKTIDNIAKKHGVVGVARAAKAADKKYGLNDPVHNKRKDFVRGVMSNVKEDIESIDEVKMADLPSTKVQGRAYGASKPEPHPLDVMKGPSKSTMDTMAKQKKDKKFSEMVNLYQNGGMKSFLESLEKEEEDKLIDEVSKEIADYTMDVIDAGEYTEVTIGEEASQDEFNAEIEKAKAKSQGKDKAEVAKGAVQAVKQEGTEITDEMIFEVLESAGIDFESLNDEELQEITNEAYEILSSLKERHMTDAEMAKREKIAKSMKKGLAGFKERYGDRAKNVMYATATKQAMKD